MPDQRFQPYNRRKKNYRDWIKLPNPVPPRTTADRIRRGHLPRDNDVEVVNNDHIIEHAAAEPQQIGAEIVNNDHMIDNAGSELQEQQELQGCNNDDQDVDGLDASGSESPNVGSSTRSNSPDSNENSSYDSNSESSSSGSEGESSGDDEPRRNIGPKLVPSLNDELYPGFNCTKFECLLMILNFSLRHGLTQVATRDLCKLVNNVLGGRYIPTSKYLFQKTFGDTPYQFHFYCRKCENYLGCIYHKDKRLGRITCKVCTQVCDVSNMNDGHFFITFPLKEQLQFLLENTDDVLTLLDYRRTRTKEVDVISDIFDGEVYSSLASNGNFLSNPYNLSLTFSTDGAQVYDAAKNTLWPVIFRVNEFAPTVRFDFTNSMVGGIWFGKTEPSMSLFLKTFVEEVKDLYENGFKWIGPDGNLIRSKCILLNCVADSKAKPLVQSVKMHSGFYGCGYCLHPGVMFEGSSQAKYPVNDNLVVLDDFSFNYTTVAVDPEDKTVERIFTVEDRTNNQIRQHMEEAEEKRNERGEGDVKGVKGKSVLFTVLYFDLVFGFAVDYLHAVLIGVVKHVTGLWLDSSSCGNLYYIGLRIDQIDERLLHIKPPVCISRRPRSLSERCHWKANEWRSWLLYYSLPCLKGILPSRYLQHHCLLVSGIHLLLQDKITKQDLYDATCYLGAYCVQFGVLYGKYLVFFNVHLLLHLGKSVYLYGPVFCYSAFSFESATGRLVQLVKGSRGVLSQIANKYTKCKAIPRLLKMYDVDASTISFCDDLMCYRTSQFAKQFDTVTVLGELINVPFEQGEQLAIQLSGHAVTNQSYERMIVGKVVFHARCYRRRGRKSDSSVVKLKSGLYGIIKRIIDPINFRGLGEPKLLILLKLINTEREPVVKHFQQGAKANHIKQCGLIVFGELLLTTADNILGPAILMHCINRSYLADFPNNFEKD